MNTTNVHFIHFNYSSVGLVNTTNDYINKS